MWRAWDAHDEGQFVPFPSFPSPRGSKAGGSCGDPHMLGKRGLAVPWRRRYGRAPTFLTPPRTARDWRRRLNPLPHSPASEAAGAAASQRRRKSLHETPRRLNSPSKPHRQLPPSHYNQQPRGGSGSRRSPWLGEAESEFSTASTSGETPSKPTSQPGTLRSPRPLASPHN